MKIRFWGVRGSIPTPVNNEIIDKKLFQVLKNATLADLANEQTIRQYIDSLPFSLKSFYGGNTACLELRSASDDLIIIDCGTGLKHLGKELMSTEFGSGNGTASVFISHTHWDHLQGIPFFPPLYVKGNVLNFYSTYSDLKERLEYQQQPLFFPISLDYMNASKNFTTLQENSAFYLNNMKITNKKMNHPGGSFGFRFEENGKSIVFTSDCEFNINAIENIDSYKDFFYQADLVIFDAQYTFSEAIDKFDWGHSSATIAIDIAAKFEVKKLILFHHDPDYSDEKLDFVLSNAKNYISARKNRIGDMEVAIAYEGLEIEI